MRPVVPVTLITLLPCALAQVTGRDLRIMPLGASITFGVGSSQGNGYRDDLYNLLQAAGNRVNMVGNHPAYDSTFHDIDTEGWPGLVISEVECRMRGSMPRNRPNIATVLCGTNDMTRDLNVGDAPNRMGRLIDGILDFPPLTLVVVSTLPPNRDANAQRRIDAFNAALPGVVQQRVNAGRSVILADCGRLLNVRDHIPDGTHPNDRGYEIIGRCFFDAINQANSRGWIFPLHGRDPCGEQR